VTFPLVQGYSSMNNKKEREREEEEEQNDAM
jgi:hypothetical protein